jgi:hypothetical protein
MGLNYFTVNFVIHVVVMAAAIRGALSWCMHVDYISGGVVSLRIDRLGICTSRVGPVCFVSVCAVIRHTFSSISVNVVLHSAIFMHVGSDIVLILIFGFSANMAISLAIIHIRTIHGMPIVFHCMHIMFHSMHVMLRIRDDDIMFIIVIIDMHTIIEMSIVFHIWVRGTVGLVVVIAMHTIIKMSTVSQIWVQGTLLVASVHVTIVIIIIIIITRMSIYIHAFSMHPCIRHQRAHQQHSYNRIISRQILTMLKRHALHLSCNSATSVEGDAFQHIFGEIRCDAHVIE